MDQGNAAASEPARILHVEDDPDVVSFVKTCLEGQGYALEDASTGEECLARFKKSPPQACLLDLALPDTSGLDLLRSLHRNYPEVPVVIVSGSSEVHDVVAAMRLGAEGYLVKPLDPRKLAVTLQNALQLSWQKKELVRLQNETGVGPAQVQIDQVLGDLVIRGGSDLHLKVGRPPLMRLAGELVPSQFPVLGEEDVRGILLQVLGRDGLRKLEEDFEFDAPYLVPDIARFRVNAYKRMGQFGAAFRVIPLAIPSFDLMGLPPVLRDICKAPQGLVLVTGPTGSGKSTTLATMIDHLNASEALHIVTIEDPVEFVYSDKKSTITQRQLGSDTKSLHEALRRVLRQDPDVILMGEMRDRETMELAMHAAETGHLVFSTLHTNDAKQTLDRIVDAFPPESAHQVRSMLALTLQAVISQRLVPRADGKGRVVATEVMVNSPNIRELIAEGKTSQIEKAIASSGDYYRMQTFNQALAKLVQEGTVKEEAALAASTNPGDLRLMLRGIGNGSGAASRPSELPAGGKSPVGASFAGTGKSETTSFRISRSF